MDKRFSTRPENGIISPEPFEAREFEDATAAVDALEELYARNTSFLRRSFENLAREKPRGRYRAYYPQVSIQTSSVPT